MSHSPFRKGQELDSGSGTPIGPGMISILMVLITLLLTAFAVLSYTTSQAEAKLTNKTLQATLDYYAADGQTEQLLFEIRTMKEDCQNVDELINALSEREDITISQIDINAYTADCYIPLDEARQIRMQLQLAQNSSGKIDISVLLRRVESTAVWEEEGIYIWDGT